MAKRKTREKEAYKQYLERTGFGEAPITTALIDMDGVLYDSMKNHTKAWIRLSEELGWNYSPEEFYLYEGMTGAAIIRLMMKREMGLDDVSDEEAKEIYAKKAEYLKMERIPTVIPTTRTIIPTAIFPAPLYFIVRYAFSIDMSLLILHHMFHSMYRSLPLMYHQ